MSQIGPSLEEVIEFVRAHTRTGQPLSAGTRLEEDVGVAGDDGVELLEAAERHFGLSISESETGIRETLGMGPNEYLFTAEGLDLLGTTVLIRWLRNEPRPVVRDLTIEELRAVLSNAVPLASGGAV